MSQFGDKLSAYLDGELPEAEAREIEAALETDPALQAELEGLMAADEFAKAAFAEMEQKPVPLALAASINRTPVGRKRLAANLTNAPARRGLWLAACTALVALGLGGWGGYQAGLTKGVQVAAAPGWLEDIADYHRVYAAQGRHLVEVPASEASHIETWLTKSIGADVRVPDLSDQGLEFMGARLLVAAGKPVSQLIYRDGEGRIVALCQIRTDTPREGFGARDLGGFTLVSWGGTGANFVIVGDEGRGDLDAIAQSAATQV